MNKDRLDWVMSGISQYKLTEKEDHFIKSVLEDFSQKNALTAQQEEKLESFYKEKSKLTPNKNYFSPKESTPAKTRARKPRTKVMF